MRISTREWFFRYKSLHKISVMKWNTSRFPFKMSCVTEGLLRLIQQGRVSASTVHSTELLPADTDVQKQIFGRHRSE